MSDHITDEQIQIYIDERDRSEVVEIEEHLKTCQLCRKNLEEYQILFKALNTDPITNLSTDLSAKITSAISASNETRGRLFESGIIIAFFLLGIATSVYFINPIPFLASASSQLFNNLSGHVIKFLHGLNGNLSLLFVAILIFLLVEVIDEKILSSRY